MTEQELYDELDRLGRQYANWKFALDMLVERRDEDTADGKMSRHGCLRWIDARCTAEAVPKDASAMHGVMTVSIKALGKTVFTTTRRSFMEAVFDMQYRLDQYFSQRRRQIMNMWLGYAQEGQDDAEH